MNRLGFTLWFFIIGIIVIGLAGCTLERRDGQNGDIEEFAPPVAPVAQQTVEPTVVVTTTPTIEPTVVTTTTPTLEPTTVTTTTPTIEPTIVVTTTPTIEPTVVTTTTPTIEPTVVVVTTTPTLGPTVVITTAPTLEPTVEPTPEPLPSPTPNPNVPVGATTGFCYRVQLGETVYSLAQQFGTSPYAINLANDLFPPNLIYVNQALFIPEVLGGGPNVYILQQGDTLASIADTCKLPATMIAGVNGLDSNVVLQEGDAIIIPIPPFPPPARFNYPTGPLPLVPYPPSCCNAYPPYRPGPPLHK